MYAYTRRIGIYDFNGAIKMSAAFSKFHEFYDDILKFQGIYTGLQNINELTSSNFESDEWMFVWNIIFVLVFSRNFLRIITEIIIIIVVKNNITLKQNAVFIINGLELIEII